MFPATETNYNGTTPATGGHVGSTGPGLKVTWGIVIPLLVHPPMLFVIIVGGYHHLSTVEVAYRGVDREWMTRGNVRIRGRVYRLGLGYLPRLVLRVGTI